MTRDVTRHRNLESGEDAVPDDSKLPMQENEEGVCDKAFLPFMSAALRGDRKGQYSIRISDKWRLCFVWTKHGPADVEIVDYH